MCFMDLNQEVLSQVTIPNIGLNLKNEAEEGIEDRVMLISGDWQDASKVLREAGQIKTHLGQEDWPKFDLILTAETTYTSAVTDKVGR